jgi:sortase A
MNPGHAICTAGHVHQSPARRSPKPGRRALLYVERGCWALGLGSLAALGVFQIALASSARHDLARFATQLDTPDQSLWSPQRLIAWQLATREAAPAPVAILRIHALRLEVAVLPGTDDRTLDRAVGHIEGTAPPGTDGNTGLAGHRDGFFRGLKDIAGGDLIELDTLQGRDVYRVERTWIVNPEEVSVLDPTQGRELTLVTCFPFYYVGAAPQRFIVRAALVSHAPWTSPPDRLATRRQ